MSCSLGVLLSVRIWERVVVPGVRKPHRGLIGKAYGLEEEERMERWGEERRAEDPRVQGSVVVRHKALPGVQVRCPVRWRLRSTRARVVQSVWLRQTMGSRGLSVPRLFLPTARFTRRLGLRTV